MKFEGPTPEDFARLERQAAEHEALDKEAIRGYREQYHLFPPENYRGIFDGLEPTIDSHAWASEVIETDSSLSPEQRVALRGELSERWRSEVLKQTGEGFND